MSSGERTLHALFAKLKSSQSRYCNFQAEIVTIPVPCFVEPFFVKTFISYKWGRVKRHWLTRTIKLQVAATERR